MVALTDNKKQVLSILMGYSLLFVVFEYSYIILNSYKIISEIYIEWHTPLIKFYIRGIFTILGSFLLLFLFSYERFKIRFNNKKQSKFQPFEIILKIIFALFLIVMFISMTMDREDSEYLIVLLQIWLGVILSIPFFISPEVA